jgi:hypothetical protein
MSNRHDENARLHFGPYEYEIRVETDHSKEELRRIARSVHEELQHERRKQAAPFPRDSEDGTGAEDRSGSAPETHDTFDEGESDWLNDFD